MVRAEQSELGPPPGGHRATVCTFSDLQGSMCFLAVTRGSGASVPAAWGLWFKAERGLHVGPHRPVEPESVAVWRLVVVVTALMCVGGQLWDMCRDDNILIS